MIEIKVSDGDIDELEDEHNARISDPRKRWGFDERRRHIIRSFDDVQACPGSGKTTLAAAKLLILAKKWEEPSRGICVLTHTNVARDEITSRLHDHPAGLKLKSYPHFVGTIQEFVNRFLGLPYCRSSGLPVSKIDDELCGQVIDRNLTNKTKAYLENKHASRYDLKIIFENMSIEILVPGFSKESTSESYKNLRATKGVLLDRGIFFYSEMYAFAKALVAEHPDVIYALRKRFPIVIIDEMQDTQSFQDTLISQIFFHESVLLQRLGDPDQAIFDGMGGDEPNGSYNNDPELYEIKTSHRFGLDICEKIIGLSHYQGDQLSSDCDPNRGACPHTIFLYDEATCERVLDNFSEIVAQADPENTWRAVKAVGGVEGTGGHISKYWSKFDRNNSPLSPKPKKLINIVHICRAQVKGHFSSNYNLLLQGIVDLLRKANVKYARNDEKQKYYSFQSLISFLRENEKYRDFKKLLTLMMLDLDLSEEGWVEYVNTLKAALDLGALTAEANEYLEYDASPDVEGSDEAPTTNVYTCANGRKIEVGTIHSVKGETHDATLILETKLRQDDVHQMLPYIIDASLDRPKTESKRAFMRKLYVAGSRPRHLLCIAMHKNNITDRQIADLKDLGWNVAPLEPGTEEIVSAAGRLFEIQ